MRRALVCLVVALCVPSPAAASVRVPPHALPRDPALLRAEKARAESEAFFASPLQGLAAPQSLASVVPGLNSPGLSAADNGFAATPPDPTGAIGPTAYVEMVNSRIGTYTRALVTTSSRDLSDFAGASGEAVFDPQIQWDQQGNRWLYLADDCPVSDCSSGNRLAFGWSKTDDPSDLTDGWCHYFVATDTLFDDYPKLGHDDNHIVFGTNVFNGTTFVSSRIWVVPKPAPYSPSDSSTSTCPASAGTPHYFSGSAAAPVEDGDLAADPLATSDNDQAFTPVPADTADVSSNAYVVAADGPAPSASQIMAWHVGGTKAAPTLTADGNIDVTSYAVPAPVPQHATTDKLDSSDTRLTQAVATADPDAGGAEAVWTQHTIDASGGRSVVRWYELIPATQTKRQQGTVAVNGLFAFNGAISPTAAGNEAAIEYNVAGSSQAPQIRASSRASADALGTMGGEVTIGSSSGKDQDFSCPSNDPTASSCRWGDYSGATPDPAAPHQVWATNQLLGALSGSDPTWTTRNFALAASGAPVASFTATPAFTGKAVSFDASASSDPDGGAIASYDWDLDGDGIFEATGVTAMHTYASPGPVTVKLRVTDSDQGATDVATKLIAVQSSAPTASFTVTPAIAPVGAPISFDGSASSDSEPGSGIASYAWDFDGNGTTDRTTTSPTVSHSYSSAGVFNAKLVVTDSDDGQSSAPAARTVDITSAPTASSPPPPAPSGGGATTPGTSASPSAADTSGALVLVLKFPKRVRLANVLRKGLAGSTACARPCTIVFTLRIPAKLARRLHVKRVVGRAKLAVLGSAPTAVRIRLSKAARRALARASAFTVVVTGSATGASGGSATAVIRVKVKR